MCFIFLGASAFLSFKHVLRDLTVTQGEERLKSAVMSKVSLLAWKYIVIILLVAAHTLVNGCE